MSSSETKAYDGSCHCGNVKYQMRLTFPPLISEDRNAKTVRMYKCNCTTCHKMGMFHCRPIDIPNDFILLSPSPEEIGDYRCMDKKIGWYFCKNCGVRTFGLGGQFVQEELDIDQWAGKDPSGNVQKVWKTAPADVTLERDGQTFTKDIHYLSVNAVTLEGVDLREWHEKGWMFYVGARSTPPAALRYGLPHEGGMY